MIGLLLLIAAVFVVYAVITYYGETNPAETHLSRILAAIGMAAAALGAAAYDLGSRLFGG